MLVIDHVLKYRFIQEVYVVHVYAINIADVSTGSTPVDQPINGAIVRADPHAQRSNAHLIKNASQSIPTLAGIIDKTKIHIKADMFLIKAKGPASDGESRLSRS